MYDRTPYDRSAYDRGAATSTPDIQIEPLAIELGLSADTERHIAMPELDAGIALGFDAAVVERGKTAAASIDGIELGLSVTLENFQKFDAYIDVTIAPGGVLVIDSNDDQYTAFLNGINVLEQYVGDWFSAGPMTLYFEIACDEGGSVDGQIEYQELWY